MHLGFSRAEVDAMTWWEKRMYIEKLSEHFAPPDEGADHDFVQPSSVSDDLSDFGLTTVSGEAETTDEGGLTPDSLA